MSVVSTSDFLHGVETIEVATINGSVSTVKTSVIGLIGTAVSGEINKLKCCTSTKDDAQFGTTGTIPEALTIIRKQYKDAIAFVVSVGTGAATPTTADFEGTVDADTGAKTGLKLFETCYSTYGYTPKVLIAPRYSATTGIAAALRASAAGFRGCAYLDSPQAMTYATAITSRGASGIWNFSDYRAKLLYPWIIDLDSNTVPYSPFAAGIRAYVDNNEGFWYSSSNHELSGISGLETPLTAAINDASCEVNQLNAIGLVSVFNTYGSGFREWGNRNAAYPVNSDSRTFEAIQRLDDITSESIELAMLPYLDKPMNKAQIDVVTDLVQSYFNTLIAKGALLPGSACSFDPTKNSVTEMAKGHFVWTKDFMGAVPGERFTFYSVIDQSLLSSLVATVNS